MRVPSLTTRRAASELAALQCKLALQSRPSLNPLPLQGYPSTKLSELSRKLVPNHLRSATKKRPSRLKKRSRKRIESLLHNEQRIARLSMLKMVLGATDLPQLAKKLIPKKQTPMLSRSREGGVARRKQRRLLG